jgi:hypothetical protein
LHNSKAATQVALIFFLTDQAKLLGEICNRVIMSGVLVYRLMLSRYTPCNPSKVRTGNALDEALELYFYILTCETSKASQIHCVESLTLSWFNTSILKLPFSVEETREFRDAYSSCGDPLLAVTLGQGLFRSAVTYIIDF